MSGAKYETRQGGGAAVADADADVCWLKPKEMLNVKNENNSQQEHNLAY